MLEGVHYSFAFAFHRERAFNVSPSTAAEVRNAAMEESEPHNESDWQRVFDRHCRTAEESTQSAESEEKREKEETNKDEEKRKEKEEQRRREATRRQTETIKEMQKRKKPLLSSWRSWTFESLDWQSGFDEGELLGNRWREWVTECGSKTLTETQRWCFEGQLHLLQTLSKEQMMRAAQEQHLLVFAVLSRSIETVKFVIQSTAENDAQTRAMLRNGEAWTGFTALHVAVFLRLERIASVLWNACKAQVCAKDLFMGSVLDYCDLLGLFKKEEEPVMHVLFWNDAEHKSEVLSSRDVWREKFGCEYQSKMTADCTWLDELMFGGVYVKDIKRALKDQCAAAQQKQRGKKRVILGRVNDDVGYGLFAFDDFGYDEVIVPYVGRLHTDRFRWTNPEKTTPMRLDFMRQIHELGPKGEGLIKPRTLPQKYARDPSFNFAILGK
jgi:hypothetical protein